MNYCMYESMHGKQADCNGACQAADKICPYYFVDTVLQIISDWKKEAGIKYILQDCPQYGLDEGYCIMSLNVLRGEF